VALKKWGHHVPSVPNVIVSKILAQWGHHWGGGKQGKWGVRLHGRFCHAFRVIKQRIPERKNSPIDEDNQGVWKKGGSNNNNGRRKGLLRLFIPGESSRVECGKKGLEVRKILFSKIESWQKLPMHGLKAQREDTG